MGLRGAIFLMLVLGTPLALLGAQASRAQVFSPGALSNSHKHIDGLSDCTKCHVGGKGHDNARCTECHTEIGGRVEAGKGYHATVKRQLCAECHKEHRGLNADIVEWPTGTRDSFNHRLTGWPLEDSHKKARCASCHEPRRVVDTKIRELIIDKGRETYLGLSTRCVDCHHDEHRGQVGNECQKCHKPTEFKKAPGFDHNKGARFALQGKHRKVKCGECHDTVNDITAAPVFPERRAATFLKMKPIPHASCTDCHDDVHQGNFGQDCTRCHTPDDWRTIEEKARDTGFHDKHAFKLRGQHAALACRTCHGPFPGEAAKYKGLKFQRCADCHFDAHMGQFEAQAGAVRCEDCHDVRGFVPVRFDQARHDKTRFPLQETHKTVPCNECHRSDARIASQLPAKVRAEVARKGRKLLVSDARFTFEQGEAVPSDAKRPAGFACDTCHLDIHVGQFDKPVSPPDDRARGKACAVCHTPTTFAKLTFTHDDSRFPLQGRHADTACGTCHVPGTQGILKGSVVYRSTPRACAACHADVHVGQLASPDGRTDCASCHAPSGFKDARFDHDTQSSFPLEGKHAQTSCARCHPSVAVQGLTVARYKPVPAECLSCHDDAHGGDFDRFNPVAPEGSPRCDGCHGAVAWTQVQFAHERTGFELTGRHRRAQCADCHGSDTRRALAQTCASCHQDPHGQEFGLQCIACHTTESFEAPRFAVDAHRRTNFPLSGRHGALPCDECHVEKRERTFARAALDCVACHRPQALAASVANVDHQRAPFVQGSCRDCHTPVTFAPATFPQHDACFPITRGVHAAVRCIQCHGLIPGSRFDGDCAGVPIFCAQCHNAEVEGPRHRNVPGYAHTSDKCYACHRTAR